LFLLSDMLLLGFFLLLWYLWGKNYVEESSAMLAIALCAALVPAQRAISIDPMQALRQE